MPPSETPSLLLKVSNGTTSVGSNDRRQQDGASEMTDVIGLASSAYEKLKKLRQLHEDMKNIETKELIAGLMNDLADIKIEAASLKDQNLLLTEAVKAKGRADAIRDVLEFKNNVYVLTKDAAGFRARTAFCPRCLDVSAQVMALTEMQGIARNVGQYKCNQCDKLY